MWLGGSISVRHKQVGRVAVAAGNKNDGITSGKYRDMSAPICLPRQQSIYLSFFYFICSSQSLSLGASFPVQTLNRGKTARERVREID